MDEFEDNSFDGAYAIEATCHAKDPLLPFKEAFRVLKPGALYLDSAWVLTDKFVSSDPEHQRIKHGIMVNEYLLIIIWELLSDSCLLFLFTPCRQAMLSQTYGPFRASSTS